MTPARRPCRPTAGPRHARHLLATLALATLAACGGGGSEPEPAAISPAQIPDIAAEAPSLPNPSAVCTAALRNDVLAYVNAYRAAGATCASGKRYPAGGAPLAWHDALESAARAHSQAMIDTNEFAHVVSGEAGLGERVRAAGYVFTSARENIAAGAVYADVAKVVAAWMKSETGHCDNIMEPTLQHVAVACLPGQDSNTYMNYWTMDLGRR